MVILLHSDPMSDPEIELRATLPAVFIGMAKRRGGTPFIGVPPLNCGGWAYGGVSTGLDTTGGESAFTNGKFGTSLPTLLRANTR